MQACLGSWPGLTTGPDSPLPWLDHVCAPVRQRAAGLSSSRASHGDSFGAVGTLAHPGWVLELGATPALQPAEARACLNLLAS